MNINTPLEQCVRENLARYLEDLGDAEPRDMLSMVVRCVERPVLLVALEKSQGNQSHAATMLGITRSTLRKKMQQYQIELG
ncbi:Fis family transcriptional regulator [Pusillimonas sp. CC-YST705]|uniref:Putative Fis-like DNA-binding protein n=1 Tax=Mesopusillimonas faecipullorum TaxID=2755040 RepID=A0ABS8C853_9BURK|nr:helix-turn-helix domain-containing protein [Mesopusillimonas faecipullorum]MCB5362206.1 Fis family transcriptional regulator [Mesopusillimonas faecipullorum]